MLILDTELKNNRLVLPERQLCGSGWQALGYICRAMLAFFCSFAFIVFINDSLAIEGDAARIVPLVIECAAFTLIFAVMAINPICFAGGAALIAVLSTFFIFTTEDFAQKSYYCAAALSNAFFRRLRSLGFNGLASGLVDFEYSKRLLGMPEEECLFVALSVLLFALSALFCAFIVKRVRMAPLLVVGGTICTICLYFGMWGSNLGFALIISALCGTAALAGYDHIYAKRSAINDLVERSVPDEIPRKRRKKLRADIRREITSLGGFSGIGAAAAALILLLIPMRA